MSMLMKLKYQLTMKIKKRYQTCVTLAHTHKPNTTSILVTMHNWSVWQPSTTTQYVCNLVVRTCCFCLIASVDHRGANEHNKAQAYVKIPITTSNTRKASTINTWIENEKKNCNRSFRYMEKAERGERIFQRCRHTKLRIRRRTHTAQMSTAGRSGHREAEDNAGVPQSENMDGVKRVKSGPNMAAASSKNFCTVSARPLHRVIARAWGDWGTERSTADFSTPLLWDGEGGREDIGSPPILLPLATLFTCPLALAWRAWWCGRTAAPWKTAAPHTLPACLEYSS